LITFAFQGKKRARAYKFTVSIMIDRKRGPSQRARRDGNKCKTVENVEQNEGRGKAGTRNFGKKGKKKGTCE